MQKEMDATLFKTKKAGFTLKIVARLRDGKNILYVIQARKGDEKPIEIYPTIEEMEELAEKFATLSTIAKKPIILDSWTMELIKRIE